MDEKQKADAAPSSLSVSLSEVLGTDEFPAFVFVPVTPCHSALIFTQLRNKQIPTGEVEGVNWEPSRIQSVYQRLICQVAEDSVNLCSLETETLTGIIGVYSGYVHL